MRGFHAVCVWQGLEVKDKADASTATPLHFVERNKDYSYDWNEWQLRRKALQIVKLRKCRTVSQQTDSSHFRRYAIMTQTMIGLFPYAEELQALVDPRPRVPGKGCWDGQFELIRGGSVGC
jgi:hypothetical protein